MIGLWLILGSVVLYIIGSFLERLASLSHDGNRHIAMLYLFAVPIAILLLPFKLAAARGGGKKT